MVSLFFEKGFRNVKVISVISMVHRYVNCRNELASKDLRTRIVKKPQLKSATTFALQAEILSYSFGRAPRLTGLSYETAVY